ncbi:hypothetical protein Tco_0302761 [Tanacetum coccineum]
MKNVAPHNDGFQVVKNRRHNNKQGDKSTGFKPKSTFMYRPVSTPSGSGMSKKKGSVKIMRPRHQKRNSFATLNEHDKDFGNEDTKRAGNEGKTGMDATKVVQETNSDVNDVYDETAQYMASSYPKATNVESTKGGSGGGTVGVFECNGKMKQDVLERESRARVDLLESQKIAEDMRVLTMDTSSLDPMNAAIVKAQQARIRAKYPTQE